KRGVAVVFFQNCSRRCALENAFSTDEGETRPTNGAARYKSPTNKRVNFVRSKIRSIARRFPRAEDESRADPISRAPQSRSRVTRERSVSGKYLARVQRVMACITRRRNSRYCGRRLAPLLMPNLPRMKRCLLVEWRVSAPARRIVHLMRCQPTYLQCQQLTG